MPRVSSLDLPGCPPLRVLTADEIGLVKVVEAYPPKSIPRISGQWGEADRAKGITCMSVSQDAGKVAVARRNSTVDICDLVSGSTEFTFRTRKDTSLAVEGDAICGIHLFRRKDSGAQLMLTCAENGAVCMRHVISPATSALTSAGRGSEGGATEMVSEWSAKTSTRGALRCTQVDWEERKVAVGGEAVDLSLWDIETKTRHWAAKNTKPDALGLTPTPSITALCYPQLLNPNRLAVGTGFHTVRMYDVASQRRPVIEFKFGQAVVKAIVGGGEHTVIVGNGMGEMGEFDWRMGKLVGGFKGACAGSVRCLEVHGGQGVVASCGLDRYIRFHDMTSRRLLGRVFLKQPLVALAFDLRPSMQPSERREDKEVGTGSGSDGVELRSEKRDVNGGGESDSEEEEEGGFGENEGFVEEDLMIGIEGGGKGERGMWGEEGFGEEEDGEEEEEGGEEGEEEEGKKRKNDDDKIVGKRLKDVGDKRRKNVRKEGISARKKKVKT